jgi:small subunit ribosomal protein S20
MQRNKQAMKRHRQSLVRRARNQHYTSMMRTYLKKARAAIESGSADTEAVVRKAVSVIDTAAKKGIIPANTASRKIGRLLKAQHKAQS